MKVKKAVSGGGPGMAWHDLRNYCWVVGSGAGHSDRVPGPVFDHHERFQHSAVLPCFWHAFLNSWIILKSKSRNLNSYRSTWKPQILWCHTPRGKDLACLFLMIIIIHCDRVISHMPLRSGTGAASPSPTTRPTWKSSSCVALIYTMKPIILQSYVCGKNKAVALLALEQRYYLLVISPAVYLWVHFDCWLYIHLCVCVCVC